MSKSEKHKALDLLIDRGFIQVKKGRPLQFSLTGKPTTDLLCLREKKVNVKPNKNKVAIRPKKDGDSDLSKLIVGLLEDNTDLTVLRMSALLQSQFRVERSPHEVRLSVNQLVESKLVCKWKSYAKRHGKGGVWAYVLRERASA